MTDPKQKASKDEEDSEGRKPELQSETEDVPLVVEVGDGGPGVTVRR